jgi:hypothetical protein
LGIKELLWSPDGLNGVHNNPHKSATATPPARLSKIRAAVMRTSNDEFVRRRPQRRATDHSRFSAASGFSGKPAFRVALPEERRLSSAARAFVLRNPEF